MASIGKWRTLVANVLFAEVCTLAAMFGLLRYRAEFTPTHIFPA